MLGIFFNSQTLMQFGMNCCPGCDGPLQQNHSHHQHRDLILPPHIQACRLIPGHDPTLHSSDTIDLVENQADSPEVVVVFQRDPDQASMKPV
jgi:hypothetical protein